MRDSNDPGTPGLIEDDWNPEEGSDEPGVEVVDVTTLHRDNSARGMVSRGKLQQRTVRSVAHKDPTADGEDRWFRGSLVKRRGRPSG